MRGGDYSLLRPVGSDRPGRSSTRRIIASTAAGALLAALVVVALSGSKGGMGRSFAERVRALATSALQEETESEQAADKYEMYGYGWVSTMRDNVRYPEDLERPYEEAPGYFGEWTRSGDSTESLPWQWAGWREAIPTGKFAKMCSWIKFVGQVPPPSHNFGFKLQGNLVNDWVSALGADEWHYVHAISHTFEGGDSNNFIMILDSVPAPAKVNRKETLPYPNVPPSLSGPKSLGQDNENNKNEVRTTTTTTTTTTIAAQQRLHPD